jgi:drug/metabolite transporter (DMT)-like permease
MTPNTYRVIGWGITLLLSLAIWYLILRVAEWSARTWGLWLVLGVLGTVVGVGCLVMAVVGYVRDLRRDAEPWRPTSWIEQEVLR